MDTVTIFIWADGTWCYPDEVHEFTHMSDDYATVEAPVDDTGWVLVDEAVARHLARSRAPTPEELHAQWLALEAAHDTAGMNDLIARYIGNP